MDAAAAPALGAHLDAEGVTVRVASRHAETVEVVLFGEDGDGPVAHQTLSRGSDGVFTGRIAGARAGMRYGLRADGPFDPAFGQRFDSAKLLVDPYAITLDRPFVHDPQLAAFGVNTAHLVPKAVLTALPPPPVPRAPKFRPGGLVYELPVKPFSIRHPDVPAALRGTIAAVAHPAALDHFKRLGVAAVELMPVTAWIDERHLAPLGLANGWGYNPVTFFALDPRLAPGGIADLRTAVSALHAEGIDVFLDVVFNHTGESDIEGPTLSLRGLDNAEYYRHAAENPGLLVNDTGCGNTLACDRPVVRRMILDAMRHFVVHAGIDGFRFDLAPILGRAPSGFSRHAPLFAEIAADPVLSDRILIAEPWDIGPDGYQLGNFPAPFLEWNDRYRDDVRRFWRGDAAAVGPLATRLAGSSDIFERNGDRQSRSVNFIAAHDGFALRDLVSYDRKHNAANGEDNRDGHDDNLSWNNGAEGASGDASIVTNRRRDAMALIATLFVSRGTIMLTAGDEFGRTQGGNNNAYAQDNPTTWLDWDGRDRQLEDHTALWSALRRREDALCNPRFLTGHVDDANGQPDVVWLHPEGREMTIADWQAPDTDAIAMVHGPATGASRPPARLAILINRARHAVTFRLPPARGGWCRLDAAEGTASEASHAISVAPRSLAAAGEIPAGATAGTDGAAVSEMG